MEKREFSYTVDGNVNWYNHYREHGWNFFKKPNIELPYDPEIPFLENLEFEKIHVPPMFTSALFTIAETWKRPKYPSTDKWIKMWYICTTECYSVTKKEQTNAICSDMDGQYWVKLVRQRESNIIWYCLHVESTKWYKWTYLQNRNRECRKQTYGYQGENGREVGKAILGR